MKAVRWTSAKPFKDQDMLDAVAHALARDSERLAQKQR